MENKIKLCLKCKLGINLQKDNYVEIKQFNKGKYYTGAFFHIDCWKQFIHGQNEKHQLTAMALNLGARTNKIIKEAGY